MENLYINYKIIIIDQRKTAVAKFHTITGMSIMLDIYTARNYHISSTSSMSDGEMDEIHLSCSTVSFENNIISKCWMARLLVTSVFSAVQ